MHPQKNPTKLWNRSKNNKMNLLRIRQWRVGQRISLFNRIRSRKQILDSKNSLSKNQNKTSDSLTWCSGAFFHRWMILNRCRWVDIRKQKYGKSCSYSWNRRISKKRSIRKMTCSKCFSKSKLRIREQVVLTKEIKDLEESVKKWKSARRTLVAPHSSRTATSLSLRVMPGSCGLISNWWELFQITWRSITCFFLRQSLFLIYCLCLRCWSRLRKMTEMII